MPVETPGPSLSATAGFDARSPRTPLSNAEG
ncbi:hypothetical protein ElP_72900 (plasmid) [Tautonia plasticadhaerens]|uniref:Uncharacterized protein n=1 Tax=Tautonia plasticadhaerens TaxID=2527974 RepID=A0A518HEQ0_9BACT|nr:hypothetical protein ElP_72900 [Tautonia plasticadhaerens]